MKRAMQCLAVAGLLCVMGQAQAGLVDVGSQYSVSNTNFVGTFTTNVTLDGLNSVIDSGQLNVSETIVPDGPNSVWVVFNFSTVSGGPLAGNTNAFWQSQINNIQFTTPVALDAFFEYWDLNGTAFSGITDLFSNTHVALNPITGVGETYFSGFFVPGAANTTQSLFTFLNPYSQLGGQNIDPSTANGWHIAGHYTSPTPVIGVPEPGTLTPAGLGAIGLIAGGLRRRWRKTAA